MNDVESVLKFAETLVLQKTGAQLNDIQRAIFREAWEKNQKTYEQIAVEYKYSKTYIQQIVGPKLWHLLSQATNQKVTKANIQTIFSQHLPSDAIAILLTPTRVSGETPKLELPCGSVPLDSPLYVQRSPHEPRCYQEILYSNALIRIKAPHQMGKTSLMTRLLSQATTAGHREIILDFQQAEHATLADLQKLLRWMCANIARQLKLAPQLEDYWDEEMGHKMSCTLYLESHILEACETPIVLVLEEVSELLEHPQVARELFTMLRAWYERTKADEMWQKLRLIMIYNTEMYVPLHINQSPFNVGTEVALQPFTREQVEDLAQRHGLALSSEQITQLMLLIAGHPYLVRLALYHLTKHETALDTLLETAHTDAGIYHKHLHRYLWSLQQHPKLEEAFQQILSSSEPIQVEQMQGFKLQSMGLVQLEGNQAKVSCQLYRRYFQDHPFSP
jgi:AAA-like domain